MKKIASLLSLFIIASLVSACSGKPNPMPRGYSSYKEQYKSAPGEKAKDIGYEFSAEKNQSVLQDMRYAAQDLAERLDERLAFDADEIYLAPPANNVFYKSFDHLLRAELTHRGYTLALRPGNYPRVDLGVIDKASECNYKPTIILEEKTVYRLAFIELAINAHQEGVGKQSVQGFYEVPLYGFVQDNAYDVQLPSCKKEKVTDKIEPPAEVKAIELVK